MGCPVSSCPSSCEPSTTPRSPAQSCPRFLSHTMGSGLPWGWDCTPAAAQHPSQAGTFSASFGAMRASSCREFQRCMSFIKTGDVIALLTSSLVVAQALQRHCLGTHRTHSDRSCPRAEKSPCCPPDPLGRARTELGSHRGSAHHHSWHKPLQLDCWSACLSSHHSCPDNTGTRT